MAPKRKRDWFRKRLQSFFSLPNDETALMPPPECTNDIPGTSMKSTGLLPVDPPPTESGGFFNNAEGFVIHNSPMTAVQGNQYTTYVQGDRNTVPQIMSLLSQHIIRGAAHDSSARTPPPRCHPGTRIKLLARITAWFEGKEIQKLLLWITGPAGVGKSALVQTFVEYLVKSESLGASVFISRPNKRNNPHGIFITIAYQLATRIEAYRNFIAARLSLDPESLSGDMQAQFATFIVEPFVVKGIGAGHKRWAILLDGLDELDGEGAQRNIIQLISMFVLEYPNTPLLWVIASRPESQISNMFDEDAMRHNYWKEDIPIDSTEACEDAERFLRSSFETMQKEFRHSIPRDWPSDTDFLKLTAATSGLFIYAQVVTQFVGDSYQGDPISRFKVLLSAIDRSNAVLTNEHPFVHLDALYHEIISSIPPALWPTAKRILAFATHAEYIFDVHVLGVQRYPHTLRGISLFSSIPRHIIYACLNKYRSTLKIPDWEVAHKEIVAFHHASFADYLKDSSRSGEFYLGDAADAKEDMVLNILEIWNQCSGDDIGAASVEYMWLQYCSRFHEETPSSDIAKFHTQIFGDMVTLLGKMAYLMFQTPAESPTYTQLPKFHMIKLCYNFDARGLILFVNRLTASAEMFNDIRVLRKVPLRNLKLEHLDWREMSPARASCSENGQFSEENDWLLHRPRSRAELKEFVSELEFLRKYLPELEIINLGATPKDRVAAFRCPLKNESSALIGFVFYVVPCPE